MSDTKQERPWTLWTLLEKYKVVIPIIQRDYAQGRKGRETIRRKLICNIREGLKSGTPVTVNMDFVYGEVNDNTDTLYPLDGQQRLTTQWLVYWYVFFMAFCKKNSKGFEEELNKLAKLTYKTRESSSDFCSCICNAQNLEDMKEAKKNYKNLYELITSRTWFLSEWLNDPTVDAMLRTLCGSGRSSVDPSYYPDNDEKTEYSCIEGIFKPDDDYNAFKNKLTDTKEKTVVFELQPIGGEELPEESADDLYIKMNARGKPLSDFENFKSDLISHIGSICDDYARKLDTEWTDVFWNEFKNEDHKEFDPSYMMFINRYIVNLTMLDLVKVKNNDKETKERLPASLFKNLDDSKWSELSEEQRALRQTFEKLTGANLQGVNANDSMVKYTDFKYYEKYMTPNVLDELGEIFEALKNEKKKSAIKKAWENISGSYSFIPGEEYNSFIHKVVAKKTEMKERVYFYATCRFILSASVPKNDEEEWVKQYSRWMRVVHNLVRNYYFNDVSDMVDTIRLIEELDKKLEKKNIYSNLESYTTDKPEKESDKHKRYREQLEEERFKAALMKDSNENSEKWSKAITEAEETLFFDGTIRFLFKDYSTDENPDLEKFKARLKKADLDEFKARLDKAKELFGSKEQNDDQAQEDDEESSNNSIPLETTQALLRQFKSFDEIYEQFLFATKGYQDRNKCWKLHILCNEGLKEQVGRLLDGEGVQADKAFKKFIGNEKLLEERLRTKDGKFRVRAISDGKSDLIQLHKENASKDSAYIYYDTEKGKYDKGHKVTIDGKKQTPVVEWDSKKEKNIVTIETNKK